MTIHVLALIHGMTTEPNPQEHSGTYNAFLTGLYNRKPQIRELIPADRIVHVEWGFHSDPDRPARPDEKLAAAERFVASRVNYEAVKSDDHPQNVVMRGFFGRDWGVPGRWRLFGSNREGLVQHGLADAVYYTSEDGERHVRNTVYQQVLSCLDGLEDAPEVRLHVVAHSLGVAVAHDFLYGLFAPDHEPDFCATGERDVGGRYRVWRDRCQAGALQLGSFFSMASQLPLFVMRKQTLIDRLAQEQLLDASVIGVTGDRLRWVICYDIDDLLGFATRRLYEPGGIREVQVDAGSLPHTAHTGYWSNETVLDEAAKLIYDTASADGVEL